MPLTPEFKAEYDRQAHRVQTGSAWLISFGAAGDTNPGSPKHLLTGNNLRSSDMKALVDLLISKGVFTEDEYLAAILQSTTEEADRLEKQISEKCGQKVTLV
jgi:hypothetical protein